MKIYLASEIQHDNMHEAYVTSVSQLQRKHNTEYHLQLTMATIRINPSHINQSINQSTFCKAP